MKTRVAFAMGSTLFLMAGLAPAGSSKAAALSPSSFHAKAKLSVGDRTLSLTNGVAILQPRLGAPGYSWLRIYLYSFPFTAEDISGAKHGDVKSMERKWSKKASNPDDYNNSHGVIQLGVDKNHKVWQVDMSVPGYTCTIAPFPKDVEAFLQSYRFDGGNLKLTSKGSYVCGTVVSNVPKQTLGWDIKIDLPVFEKKQEYDR
jgi:hypothetical protein